MPDLLFIDHRIGLRPGAYPLSGTPHTAHIAGGITDAINIARISAPDVLLFNPQTFGAGQLMALREMRGMKSVPTLMYTDDPTQKSRFPLGQIDAVVRKQDGIGALIRTVEQTLDNYGLGKGKSYGKAKDELEGVTGVGGGEGGWLGGSSWRCFSAWSIGGIVEHRVRA